MNYSIIQIKKRERGVSLLTYLYLLHGEDGMDIHDHGEHEQTRHMVCSHTKTLIIAMCQVLKSPKDHCIRPPLGDSPGLVAEEEGASIIVFLKEKQTKTKKTKKRQEAVFSIWSCSKTGWL